MHAETLRERGSGKLPFAEYSVVHPPSRLARKRALFEKDRLGRL